MVLRLEAKGWSGVGGGSGFPITLPRYGLRAGGAGGGGRRVIVRGVLCVAYFWYVCGAIRARTRMTAEIAILNKNAVALAADSAVTLRNPQTQKVYNTANKLFMLSKYHPVGIMIHGSAEIMGVPWETVIKVYREQLETTNFNRLIEFAENFISFLEDNELLFPDRLRSATFAGLCEWPLVQIKNAIDARVQAQISTFGEIDDDGINRIISEIVTEHLETWRRYDRLSCFPEGFEENFLGDCGASLNEKLDAIFMELPIAPVRSSLLEICSLRATKEWWSVGSGGIVIAGFGKTTFSLSCTATLLRRLCETNLNRRGESLRATT